MEGGKEKGKKGAWREGEWGNGKRERERKEWREECIDGLRNGLVN